MTDDTPEKTDKQGTNGPIPPFLRTSDATIAHRVWQAALTQGLTTISGIAEKAGKSPSHLGKVLEGRRRWTDKMVHALALALDVDSQWLRTGVGELAATNRQEAVSCVLIGRVYDNPRRGELSELEHPLGQRVIGHRIALVEVASENLIPLALPTQMLIVDTTKRPVHDGDLVVLQTIEGDVRAGRAYHQNDSIQLFDVNPSRPTPPFGVAWSEVGICYPVIGVIFE